MGIYKLTLDNPKPDIYLHIGLLKTATTSLQMYFFNCLNRHVDYLGVKQSRVCFCCYMLSHACQQSCYDFINDKLLHIGL